jgi:hypothetical protein
MNYMAEKQVKLLGEKPASDGKRAKKNKGGDDKTN